MCLSLTWTLASLCGSRNSSQDQYDQKSISLLKANAKSFAGRAQERRIVGYAYERQLGKSHLLAARTRWRLLWFTIEFCAAVSFQWRSHRDWPGLAAFPADRLRKLLTHPRLLRELHELS